MQLFRSRSCASSVVFFILVVFLCLQQKALASLLVEVADDTRFGENLRCLDTANIQESTKLTPFILYKKAKEEVTSLEALDHSLLYGTWQRNPSAAPNLGIGAGRYLFVFCLQNKALESWTGLIEISMPMLDYLDQYEITDTSFTRLAESGNRRPFSSRAVSHRHHVFRADVTPASQVVYLFSVENLGTLRFPAKIWREESFYEKDLLALALQFLLAGIGLALVLYNFFLLVSTRDIAYFWYVISVFSINVYSLCVNGVFAQFVWPNWPNFDNWVAPGSAGMLLFSASVFAYYVLDVRLLSKRIKWSFGCSSLVGLTFFLLSPILDYSLLTKLGVSFGVVIPLFFISMGLYLSLKGNRLAIIYTSAWLVFAVGSVVLALNHIAVLPDLGVFKYGLQIGSAIEGLLLSFALAYRLNREKQAHFAAQAEVLHLKESIKRELEVRVEERTQELNFVQDSLVQKEKLAALGALVAGVAHELNTPVGNSLVVVSSLVEETKQISRAIGSGISRSRLDQYIENMKEGTDLLMINLGKTSELVLSFKQVAVDRTSAQRRKFDLISLLNETRITIESQLKNSPYSLKITEAETVELDSYPGPLGQVITNLVNNAIAHGFEGREDGKVVICPTLHDDMLKIVVEDNGCGIDNQNLQNIFDPFFTTKLGKGGSGLGLHIVHNIVVGVLGGSINVVSKLNTGTTFIVDIPLRAPLCQDIEQDIDKVPFS